MTTSENKEIEAKFYLTDLEAYKCRLDIEGAHLIQSKIHEYNLSFDTPNFALLRKDCILRLRRDTVTKLTYKGTSDLSSGVTVRQEIEIIVDSFDNAKLFLESLGYCIHWVYEKYRTTYSHKKLVITIDETPIGIFTEIEGKSMKEIRRTAERLGLNWNNRILSNYLADFLRVQKSLQLPFRDMTFENFKNVTVTASDLGVVPAD